MADRALQGQEPGKSSQLVVRGRRAVGFAPNPCCVPGMVQVLPQDSSLGSVLGLIWPPESFESSAVRQIGHLVMGCVLGQKFSRN